MVSCQQARLRTLKEMTELMDSVAERTRDKVTRYSIIADPEVVEARRKARQDERDRERKEIEALREELAQYEAREEERKVLYAEIERVTEAVTETAKLKESLREEAATLMRTIVETQERRGQESELSKEVKALQKQVSVLLQVNNRFCTPLLYCTLAAGRENQQWSHCENGELI